MRRRYLILVLAALLMAALPAMGHAAPDAQPKYSFYFTFQTPSFDSVAVGYAQPAAKPISIKNTSETNATITSVTVSPSTAFTIIPGNSSLAAYSTNTSYTIQPKVGLAEGLYTATVYVSCQGGTIPASGDAPVNFLVGEGEEPDPDPDPTVYSPSVSGSNTFSYSQGAFSAIEATGSLSGAKPGTGVDLTARISGLESKATGAQNGQIRFPFTAAQLNTLAPGDYSILVSSPKSADNNAISSTSIGTVTVKAVDPDPQPGPWSIPATLRASVGVRYVLIDSIQNGMRAKISNGAIVGIDSTGVIKGKKPGTATITITDAAGVKKTCRVTVVANKFSRAKPLYLSGTPGIFSSTRSLTIEKGKLVCKVFVFNRTGNAISGLAPMTFRLLLGDEILVERSVPAITFSKRLAHKGVKTFTIAFTAAELPASLAIPPDVGSKNIHALLTGTEIIPVTASTPGAAKSKEVSFVTNWP